MSDIQSWQDLLSAFRALGGRVDNVEMVADGDCRGLFRLDPLRPTRIFVPTNLMIPVNDVKLAPEGLRLKKSSKVGPDVAEFFCAYHAFTSWGGVDGARDEIAEFLNDLHVARDTVKSFLKDHFYFSEQLKKPTPKRVLQRFLHTRQIDFDGKEVFFPVLELMNHDSAAPQFLSSEEGIDHSTDPQKPSKSAANAFAVFTRRLTGQQQRSEVLARYSIGDSWKRFYDYGFATRERLAFSDLYETTTPDGVVSITVRDEPGENRELDDGRLAPIVKTQGNEVDISFLVLGDREDAEAPLKLFWEEVVPALAFTRDEAIALFNDVLTHNRDKFTRLENLLQPYRGAALTPMRDACLYQLEVLNAAIEASALPNR